MKNSTFKTVVTVFGFIAILFTLMPFVALDYWWIRMFDFPHLQLTFLTALALLIYFVKFDFKNWRDYFFATLLISCFIFQFSKIFPYTAFAKYEILETVDDKVTISLFTSNVLQKNVEYEVLNNTCKQTNADVLLFTETNEAWKTHITKGLSPSYKGQVEVPKDNTYGMLLYSKFELFDTHVKYLVSDSVPSIHTKLKLTEKDTVQIYAIHPTPPMPQENPSSADRDAEMMMIAQMALKSKYPVIVIGDFNDVAWSQTSKLFQNVSRLLDVRKGRGLYNTYDANSYIMRWPLDHIFLSNEFRLDEVRRCQDVHSDHFPLYTKFSFEPELKDQQTRPYPTDEQLKRAQDQIDNFYDNLKNK
ncbi:endonuclease/exonuclease/phosphatase family protein [Winogradskyella ursingii]|uniref:endonuclease/exonuclease/phosphatase family protein n=1 Tax=Winogradskyella ursingii TaxID=2686079 RepID=UPI0015CBF0FB|nr:endonuclease/exonuclease/phosphatase family protein [Winogradskyella ursingii]